MLTSYSNGRLHHQSYSILPIGTSSCTLKSKVKVLKVEKYLNSTVPKGDNITPFIAKIKFSEDLVYILFVELYLQV